MKHPTYVIAESVCLLDNLLAYFAAHYLLLLLARLLRPRTPIVADNHCGVIARSYPFPPNVRYLPGDDVERLLLLSVAGYVVEGSERLLKRRRGEGVGKDSHGG